MNTRLILISQASTAAMRQGRFPNDDTLDERAVSQTTLWRRHMPVLPGAIMLCSPQPSAVATAQALGIAAQTDDALREADFGDWRGRRLLDVAAETPADLQAWIADPAVRPPGGESFEMVLSRVGEWMDGQRERQAVVAVTHATVIRAAVLTALHAPSSSFKHVEVPPLSVIESRHSARGWTWWPGRQ